jgi:light-regulated signal transduction histidine kinase (bacteriophytochrome)
VKLVQRLAQLGTLSRRGAALELAERGEFVDMAIRQGTRLKEPIEQLLLAARFEQTGRERVFERFTQLDSGATRRAGGVGLGLYIARQLANAQGGELLCSDPVPPGQGARFELRLPLATLDQPELLAYAASRR